MLLVEHHEEFIGVVTARIVDLDWRENIRVAVLQSLDKVLEKTLIVSAVTRPNNVCLPTVRVGKNAMDALDVPTPPPLGRECTKHIKLRGTVGRIE
jgi:hypothetical protein